MTTPALQRLREAKPQASITLLTPQKLAELWRHHPSVDAVLTFTRDESVFQIGRRLQKEGFDLALVLPNSPRSALEVFLARIPVRIGGAAPWRNFLLTRAIPPRPEAIAMRKRSAAEIRKLVRQTNPGSPARIPDAAHQVHHYLNLAAVLGASREPLTPRIYISESEIHAFKKRFNILPEPGERRPWFGMNPGAEYGPAKRWPVERFAQVAKHMATRGLPSVVAWGGQRERAWAEQIIAESGGTAILAPTTSLLELAALLRRARLFVGSDTGPLHLAAAVGTPCVAMFGASEGDACGPYGSVHVVLQAAFDISAGRKRPGADNWAMRQISAEHVAHACDRLLSQSAGSSTKSGQAA
jgi:ADP-heptose:LPS heptosyltransferase